jgi:hypothetical protein
MELDTGRLVMMIERNMLAPSLITFVLREYSSKDRANLATIIAALSYDQLTQVFDILTLYPATDAGWAVLPHCRADVLRPDFSREEESDIDKRQFGEDRSEIESLRETISSRIEALEGKSGRRI